jgi:hypothetical protein
MMPRRLQIAVEPITKATYTKMSKHENVVAKRPCGFVVEEKDGRRYMFIDNDGTYYMGRMYPWDSLDAFSTMQFDGVESITRAVFMRVLEAA